MADKMLIDATHPEETRVVVLRGNRVEEFDFESANRKQLRGNIYLAKVTRVEPSLQAAFVDYGGNRHGFLAFSEIHPDYYQIPVADRQALLAQEERDQRAADAEAESRAGRRGRHHRRRNAERHRDQEVVQSEPLAAEQEAEAPHHAVEPSTAEPSFGEAISDQVTAIVEPASEDEVGRPHSTLEADDSSAAEPPASELGFVPPETPETIAEGEQPSAPAEGELNAETVPGDAFGHTSELSAPHE